MVSHLNPLKCLKKMQDLNRYSRYDFIMLKIQKYLKLNFDQGRCVMVTFLHRDLDYGNRQADAYGKLTENLVNFTL